MCVGVCVCGGVWVEVKATVGKANNGQSYIFDFSSNW